MPRAFTARNPLPAKTINFEAMQTKPLEKAPDSGYNTSKRVLMG